jgi:hypothetical protein
MFSVECAAEIWEAGEILELRVFTGETVRARDGFGVAVRVVVNGVGRDFMGSTGKDVTSSLSYASYMSWGEATSPHAGTARAMCERRSVKMSVVK